MELQYAPGRMISKHPGCSIGVSLNRFEILGRANSRRVLRQFVDMERFDVFLSHRSEDDESIVRIATLLRDASLEPWIDNWYCEGGGRWQSEIAEGIKNSRAFAVFLGASGMSGWVDEELAVALSRAAKDRDYRVFLVLLPKLRIHSTVQRCRPS